MSLLSWFKPRNDYRLDPHPDPAAVAQITDYCLHLHQNLLPQLGLFDTFDIRFVSAGSLGQDMLGRISLERGDGLTRFSTSKCARRLLTEGGSRGLTSTTPRSFTNLPMPFKTHTAYRLTRTRPKISPGISMHMGQSSGSGNGGNGEAAS